MDSWLSTLGAELQQSSWVDWTATVLALGYVILAARNNPWGWVLGAISCSLWAYASYVYYSLYLDAILQVFYVLMAGIGLYQWQRGGAAGQVLPVSEWPLSRHIWLIGVGALLSLGFGYFFATYTPAAATYWDAGTTVFSVAATVLLVRRVVSNWLYWIGIDLVYSGLYYSRGALLFAALMLVYTVIAVIAYRSWQRERGNLE